MNDKYYQSKVNQSKLKLTKAEIKADNNFIAAIVICVLLSILCFSECSIQLKKQSHANTNTRTVLP